MEGQYDQLRSSYLKQTLDSMLYNVNRRVLQLDDTLTVISDKLGDMDKRAEELAKVVRESSLAGGAIEALMRRNVSYALFVTRGAENFLREQMRWSKDDENKRDSVGDEGKGELLEDETVLRKEDMYRIFAEEDIYGMSSNFQFKQRTGQSRQDQYQKYLSLLWSLTGQKFRQQEGSPVARQDVRGCSGGRWKWLPSGFDLVEIIGIVYHSMPQDEQLRRLFNRLIDAEMRRRQAQQYAEEWPDDDVTVVMTTTHQPDVTVAMTTTMHPNQLPAPSSKDGLCAAGRRLFRRQEGGAIGTEAEGLIGDWKRSAGSGDMMRGGDVTGGVQNGGDGSRNCLRNDDVQRGVSDSCEAKGTSALCGTREGLAEGRMAAVAGRRTYGRVNCRKSQCTGIDCRDRRTAKTAKEGHPKVLKKKKSGQQQKGAAATRKATAPTKNTRGCPEGGSQILDGEDKAAVAAAEKSPNRNWNSRPEPVRVRSSASYTLCTLPLEDDAALKAQRAQRAATPVDERTKK